jgi:hypothetical protein
VHTTRTEQNLRKGLWDTSNVRILVAELEMTQLEAVLVYFKQSHFLGETEENNTPLTKKPRNYIQQFLK